MAIDSTLGVRPIDTGFLRDISRQQSAMLEQLGAQVRQDVAQIQTNRQLQGFSQAVQGIDPTSPGYAQQIIGAISSYPLAAQSPLGTAVINQLGAAHKLWQQEQAEARQQSSLFDRQIGLALAQDAITNRPYGSPAPSVGQIRRQVNGGGGPIAPYEEPPLPQPNESGDVVSGLTEEPAIPSAPQGGTAAPATIPGLPADATAAQPQRPVSPLNNMGAQLQAFDNMLRRQKIPAPMARQMQKEFVDNLMKQNGATPKTSFSWQGYGRVDPVTGQPQWTPNPLARNGAVTGVQKVELDRKIKERDSLSREFMKAEAKMEEDNANWTVAGKAWDANGNDKKAKERFEMSQSLAESSRKRAERLREKMQQLDDEIRKMAGSGEQPTAPATPNRKLVYDPTTGGYK